MNYGVNLLFLFFSFFCGAQTTTFSSGGAISTQTVSTAEDWDILSPDVVEATDGAYAGLAFTATLLTPSEYLETTDFTLGSFPSGDPISNASVTFAIENFTGIGLLTDYSVEVLRTESATTTTMLSQTGQITLTALTLINETFDNQANWNYASLDGANLNNSTFEVRISFSYTAGAVVDIGIDEVNLEFSTEALVLPVTWQALEATSMGDVVNIYWSTASEENVSHFEIEHSLDSYNWSRIGVEKSIGMSNSLTEYSFDHHNANYGANYYRIKEMDFDGKSDYSSMVLTDFWGAGKPTEFWVASSMGDAQLKVKTNSTTFLTYNFELFDASGIRLREWNRQPIIGKMFELELPNLESGVYYLRIYDAEGNAVKTLPMFFGK